METECDALVVGGGPAGITAAIYLKRAGKKVLLAEAEALGGQILQAREVENYPGTGSISGGELAAAMEEQLRALEVPIIRARVTGLRQMPSCFQVETTDAGILTAQSVILAVGAEHRKLGVPGEDRLTGRGVSWCATCDGNFFRGKTVAVVGGGNTAVQEALDLAQICKRVYLLHRRRKLRAEPYLTDRLRGADRIEFLPSTVIRAVIGTHTVEALHAENTETGERFSLAVDGLFEAVGMIPRNLPFAETVQTDESGYFVSDETCQTNIPGIYAAGDCRAKQVRQLVTAVSDGCVAALQCSDGRSWGFAPHLTKETF